MAYYELIIGFIAGACGSLLLWITIGRRMMLKYAGQSVINAFKEPSPELEEALDSLVSHIWKWLNAPSIEVQGPSTEDGTPTKTKISPIQNVMAVIVTEVVNRIVQRIRGVQGAATRDAGRMEASLATQMGIPLPRKGQTTGEFLMEQMASRLMPVIEQKISKMVDNAVTGSGSEGKEGW